MNDIEEIRWNGFGDYNIGDEGAIKLANWLKNNKSLRILNIKYNNISSIGAKVIAQALEGNNTLKELNLYGNEIGAAGCKDCAQMLKINTSINSLNLRCNYIGNEGAEEISKILTSSTLTSLNLFSNYIGEEGAKVLLSPLASSPYFSMSYLDLKYNPISSPMQYAINSIVKNNKLMADSLKGDNQGDRPPANLSAENHIRCYNLPLSDLDLYIEELSEENKWLQITSIFLYGTEFDDLFLSKWISSSSTSNQIFSSITTLTFQVLNVASSLVTSFVISLNYDV